MDVLRDLTKKEKEILSKIKEKKKKREKLKKMASQQSAMQRMKPLPLAEQPKTETPKGATGMKGY